MDLTLGEKLFTEIITWRHNNGFHFSPKGKNVCSTDNCAWGVKVNGLTCILTSKSPRRLVAPVTQSGSLKIKIFNPEKTECKMGCEYAWRWDCWKRTRHDYGPGIYLTSRRVLILFCSIWLKIGTPNLFPRFWKRLIFIWCLHWILMVSNCHAKEVAN